MAQHRLVLFGDTGGVIASDPANTSGTVMERDANGVANSIGLNCGTAPNAAPAGGNPFFSNAGSAFQANQTQTGTNALTPSSAFIQLLNAATGAFTTTLPPVATSANLEFFLIKSDSSANLPTLKGSGTDNIIANGSSANTYTAMAAKGSGIYVWCDGSQWWSTVFAAGKTIAGGSAPTAAAGANAGAAPPAPVVAGDSNDSRGSLTFGTGTGPTAGPQVVVTFNAPLANAPRIVLNAQNVGTVALQPYVSARTATAFTISLGLAPAASQGNTTYGVDWEAIW